jgi:hypothetical protein
VRTGFFVFGDDGERWQAAERMSTHDRRAMKQPQSNSMMSGERMPRVHAAWV